MLSNFCRKQARVFHLGIQAWYRSLITVSLIILLFICFHEMYTSFAYTLPLTNQCYHVFKCIATHAWSVKLSFHQNRVICLTVRAQTLYFDYNTAHRLAVSFQGNEYYFAYQKQIQ